MKPQDRAAFVDLLAGVFSIYRQDVSEFALSVWWNACHAYDLEQVRAAFNAHAMDPEEGRFPPKPADIVRQLHGTHGDRALVAWGKAYEAMQRVGAWQSVIFDDGLIHAVIEDLGGWPEVCRTQIDELPFLQKRFCDAYRAYSRRGDVAYPPRLTGISEAENSRTGYPVPPPVLVGDERKAREVARLGVTTTRTPIAKLTQGAA